MTTEQFEEQLTVESPAVHLLSDTVSDYLLNRGHAAKIGEIATQAGKRLGANAKLIRKVLSDNQLQFVNEERRWNLSIRSLFHRPIEGALQQVLRLYGKPLSLNALSNELAVLNARSPEYFRGFLPAFLAKRDETYFSMPADRWGLHEWLLDITSDDEEEMLQRNFFAMSEKTAKMIAAVRKVKIAKLSVIDAAYAILSTLHLPVSTRMISLAIWLANKGVIDPLDIYLQLEGDPRFHMLSGSNWLLTEEVEDAARKLQELSVEAEVTLEEEDVSDGPYIATEEDLTEIHDYLVEHGRAEKLSDLIEAVLEYSRTSPRYQSVSDSLLVAITEDERFQQVGVQTWILPAMVPAEVNEVPAALQPEFLDPALLPDPETDAELEDEGLDGGLAMWVHDPRYEDFGGEHEVELSPELMSGETILDETRISLLYDHREMGTLKLRQADMAFFPNETSLACLTVDTDDNTDFQMWISNSELLIHGLANWYDKHDLPVGAVLNFKRGAEPDDFLLTWDGEIDSLVAISEDRIAELLEMHEPAAEENWSVFDVMRHVMAGNPEGSLFLTIWAEVNVIRRTPKRIVASNLSSYHCFVQITNSERWKLDERKIEQGRKKTKKRFIQQ